MGVDSANPAEAPAIRTECLDEIVFSSGRKVLLLEALSQPLATRTRGEPPITRTIVASTALRKRSSSSATLHGCPAKDIVGCGGHGAQLPPNGISTTSGSVVRAADCNAGRATSSKHSSSH